MNAGAQSVYRVEEIRAIERAFPGADLMQRAGEAALAALSARWPDATRVVVVAGPGNNGGDGRVLARVARKSGFEVTIVDFESRREGAAPLPGCDVIVDALFGIGLSRAPDGDAAALIDAMNLHPAPVFALDVPSGLDADTGVASGPVVRADATITFIAYKPGLFLADGPRHAGVVTLADLDVPESAFAAATPTASVIPDDHAYRSLGRRPHDAHKGDFGHVLVVGGRPGMSGAAALAADAALRTGAGKVSAAVGAGSAARFTRAEVMAHEVGTADDLAPLVARADVVAVGPGLGTDAWSRTMLDVALACGKPLVVDADALNLLAGSPARHDDWIVTPHPGEAARLLGTTATEVQRDRFAAATRLAQMTGAVVVLKGSATVVATPDGALSVCRAGNPGLASGGTGDLLTGVIAALRAQGLDAPEAATAGVQLHAEAGDLAARDGERGLIASDLLPFIRRRANGVA